MEEWKECRIGDVCETQTGPFGCQLHNEDYVAEGTPIVTVEHLGNRNFTTQNLPLISDEDKNRLNKYILKEGDVVFSRVGSVDRCSYVSTAYDGWLFSGRCLRVRAKDSNLLDSTFLYYHFNNENIRTYIRNVAVGATMPSINTKLLNEVPVKLPPIEVQKKIAGILSSLDEKIETNRKINARLEELAQGLFKSWFIDFEPFGGVMPEGWNKAQVGDVSIINANQYSLKENWSDFLYLDTGNVTENIIGELQKFSNQSELPSRVRRKVKDLDTIYSTVRPNQRHLGMILNPGKNWLVSTGFAVISAKKSQINPFYLYMVLSQRVISDYLQAIGEQAACAYPSITTSDIAGLDIVIPDFEIQKKFGEIISKLFQLRYFQE